MKKLLGLYMLVLLVSCTKSHEGKLVIGMELAYPPFETTDADGNPMGVSVDLANALGEYLGKEVKIENTAWAGLIPALQTGKVDAVISSMTITDDRKQQVSFSDPYAQATIAILANADSPINSLEELNQEGRVVVVKQGTSPYLFAMEVLTNATINSFSSESAALTELVQGKADGMLYDQLTTYRNYVANSNTTKMIPITQLEKDTEKWGIAVKKDNTELLNQINAFLIEFISNDGFDEITEKHLKKEKEIFEQNGLTFFF